MGPLHCWLDGLAAAGGAQAGLWAAAQTRQMSDLDVACWLAAEEKDLPGCIADETATRKARFRANGPRAASQGIQLTPLLRLRHICVAVSLQEGRLPGHIKEIKQHRLEKGEGRAAELSNLLADRSALISLYPCCTLALLRGKVPRMTIATARCQASIQQLL